MSISYCGYLGPYLECQLQATKVQLKERSCRNTDCLSFDAVVYSSNTKFCSACGSQIQAVTKQEDSVNVNPGDLAELIHESLYTIQGHFATELEKQLIHIWLDNRRHKGRSYNIDFDKSQNFEIDPTDIPREIEEFSSRFQKEISQFRQHYGENKVTVKWGWINFVS